MKIVRWPFIIVLAIVSLVALFACSYETDASLDVSSIPEPPPTRCPDGEHGTIRDGEYFCVNASVKVPTAEAEPQAREWKLREESEQALAPVVIRRSSPSVIELGAPASMTINSTTGPLVIIDMQTGHAQLFGDPNEAARRFWAAVAHTYPQPCKSVSK